jgi:hypothetical protein
MIRRSFLIPLFLFIVGQFSFYGCDTGKKDNNNQLLMMALASPQNFTPTPPASGVPAATADWNFLVYLDGDNNLEDAGIYNFCQMEQVGSTDKVNILVLFDRIRGYDSTHGNWSGTRLYRVTRNIDSNVNDPSEFTSTLLSEWGPRGEADMSDPKTLQGFIEYCHQWFPATKTVLTLWNHGAGVYPRLVTKNSVSQGICFDDTTGKSSWNCLTTDEVANALTDAQATTGQKIDIINNDACLMQLVEVMYQWKDNADYLVGSEQTTPWYGNSYDTLLTYLTANSTVTARNFAIQLVDDFHAFYQANPALGAVTYSAADLTKVDSFMTTYFIPLASELNDDTANHAVIRDAYANSTQFDYTEIIDLDNFVTYLATNLDGITGHDLKDAAGMLEVNIDTVVFHQKATGAYNGTTYGMAITLPFDSTTWSYYSGPDRYVYLDISADTQWDEFIQKFISW